MDEIAYRQALSVTVPRSCPFEKSILTMCAACSRAEKRNIAEREIVACNNVEAHRLCIELRDLLRINFTFSLGKTHIDGPLPHSQEMRMQCGGLKGLQFVLDGGGEAHDVAALLGTARQKFGELPDFPFEQIVRLANIHYKPR